MKQNLLKLLRHFAEEYGITVMYVYVRMANQTTFETFGACPLKDLNFIHYIELNLNATRWRRYQRELQKILNPMCWENIPKRRLISATAEERVQALLASIPKEHVQS